MIAVSTFKRKNYIQQNAKVMIKEAIKLGYQYTEVSSYKFEELDTLMVAMNLSCALRHKKVKTITGIKTIILKPQESLIQYLYLLKIYNLDGSFTGICKIGVAESISKRIKNLNNAWSEHGYFELHLSSYTAQQNMTAIEASIHTVLTYNGLKYTTEEELDGFTELFVYQDWLDHLISGT